VLYKPVNVVQENIRFCSEIIAIDIQPMCDRKVQLGVKPGGV